MTIAFHTLGCKVNQYDTQAMLELFRQAGYQPVPFEGPADVYVLNTCTVTGTGDKKSLQLARRLHREHPDAHIVLCGCLAQRKGAQLLDTGARLVLGTQNRAQVVELLEQAIREDRQLAAVAPLTDQIPFECLSISGQDDHTRATIKIQEGCRNRCTYCIIPEVRGPIRSRPLSDIRAEAARLRDAGFTELVVTGIHLSSYGRDLADGTGLLDALQVLQDTEGIRRIRLGSLEPTIATEEFVKRLSGMDRICPQFHLALQSGSDTVLARMARRYNMTMYRKGVENMLRGFPRAAMTTDILTGFPGETEEEFQETCRVIDEIGFARIHVFPYSPREGTPAARMPGQLTTAVKEARARCLIRIGNEASRRYRESWLNDTAPVLFEEKTDEGWVGHTPEYIRVAVSGDASLTSGLIRDVRLTGLTDDGMAGIIV